MGRSGRVLLRGLRQIRFLEGTFLGISEKELNTVGFGWGGGTGVFRLQL
jgi:hypothetical protein